MRFLRVGEDALLVELAGTAEALRLYDEARRRAVVVADLVPAARTVLFSGVPDVRALQDQVASWTLGDPDEPRGERRVVEVPTRYDGPDLPAVAEHWGVTVEEVVRRHTGTDMVVAFCGFAPGFAYCSGLEVQRPVPRLADPRTRVPAGSVALADVFTGVYPAASPGGWRLIGRTDLVLWDETRDVPATLAPGTVVRFVRVSS
jgi:KipI family sensor histidine kinase inhibitor